MVRKPARRGRVVDQKKSVRTPGGRIAWLYSLVHEVAVVIVALLCLDLGTGMGRTSVGSLR